VSGTATNRLTVQNVQAADAGAYQVITNAWGAVTSSVATLTIATARYVNVNNSSPSAPYTSWATAATNIQDAVGVALASDSVVADAGVYNVGGTVVYGQESNRVALTNAITLLSVYGPQFTAIAGGSQTRCVYVGSNAALSGFTLTNGQTRDRGDAIKEQSGGGIWGEVSGAVTNCWIVGNSASYWSGGGGAYGAAFYNCTLSNNTSSGFAGGAYQSKLVDCTIVSNSAYFPGGGTYAATVTTLIGTGKAVDTNRFFVICSNIIGGCMGSSGPAEVNPATGQPYGLDFPLVTIRDMVRAQAMLLDHLGIEGMPAAIRHDDHVVAVGGVA